MGGGKLPPTPPPVDRTLQIQRVKVPKSTIFQLTTELYLRVYQRINKINEMTMTRFLSVPLILLTFSLNIN